MQRQTLYFGCATNTMAIISLIAGLLSWFAFPVIGRWWRFSPGIWPAAKLETAYGAQGGDGLAVAGLVLGYLNLAMMCVGILVFVLIFGGMIGLSGCALLAGGN